ncbi:MAG: aldehyde dehydrogenase family protein [Deltaproteobacteria bacterium]|nr:aldehyde dehydrogenase family protein [Deltaproteobacteria bacterium]
MSEVKTYLNFIDGKWTTPSTGKYYPDYNPADDRDLVGHFPLSGQEDAAAAVESADRAFRNWGRMLPAEREKYIDRFVALLDQNRHRIGEALCREEGKTLKEALGEPTRGVVESRYFLGEGQRLEGITMPSDRPGVTSVAVRVPIGVVAAIAPWNFPFLTPLRKIMPALATGNTVVFKPAYDTPHCGVLLMELFEKAGFPPGVVNMVIGRGSVMGDAISGNPLVRGITFTGSTSVGRRINETAAKNFAKVQLEMGGKNPAIVADYQNLDFAAAQIAAAAFAVSGQRCTSISRVLVLKRHAEALEEMIAEKMKTYVLGNGMDPKVSMGPIINRGAGEGIMAHIQSAREAGATIRVGGHQLKGGDFDRGFYVEPTLITDVTPDMKVAIDEIFGPVLVSIKVDSFDEAMAVANRTEYGLAASLFSDNLEYIYQFQRDIETGMAHVNHGTVTDGCMPFGGVKGSGLGAFSKGATNKDFFTTYKVNYIRYV